MTRLASTSMGLPLVLFILAGCSTPRNHWAEVLTPSAGEAHSIGSHSAGCLTGAASLAPDGPGYQMMRLTRRRFYGHPLLVNYVRGLGAKIAKHRLGVLLVGDLGQPRGGPTPSAHRSHQTGLDVDLWFLRDPAAEQRSLTLDERESRVATSLLAADHLSLDPALWTPAHREVLFLAAESPDVERIFVNPAIKKRLCEDEKGAAWLRKLRPWYGHDDHFHTRLKCPALDLALGACRSAADPLPEGSGCDDTLAWWFSDEARAKAAAADESGGAIPPLPKLPDACAQLLLHQ